MKKDIAKSLFLAILLLIGAASLHAGIAYADDPAPSVTSLLPYSGPPGARVTVKGTGFSISSLNTIQFNAEDGSGGTTFFSGSPDGARLYFYVPNLSTGTYRITVSNNKNGTGTVYQTFTLLAQSSASEPSLAVAKPNGGETMTLGSQYIIRWTAANMPDTANLYANILSDNGAAFVGRIARNLGTSTGSYIWTIGTIYTDSDLALANPQTLSPGRYSVQVKSGMEVNNVSNGAFTIAAPSVPTVTSISPSSGPQGTIVTVTGSGFSTSSPNTIHFNAESGGGGTTFTAVSPDGTTLQFTAPDLSLGPYRITVSVGGSGESATGQTFTLTAPSRGEEGGGGGGGNGGGGGGGRGGGGGVGGGPLPGTIGVRTPSGQTRADMQAPTTTPQAEISTAAPFATSSPTTSTTTVPALPKTPSSCIKIEKFIRLGAANDPVEVRKVQSFLRNYGRADDVRETGIYDIATYNAVKAFQQKYMGDVLAPWTASQPTGYVFITTRKKMNEILCAGRDPFTPEETAAIAAYRRNLTAGVMGALSNTIIPAVSSQKGTEEIKPLTDGEKTVLELYGLKYENAATGVSLAQDESSPDETAESIAANKTGVIQTSLSAAVGFLKTVASGITVAGERTARGGELLFKKTGDFFRAIRTPPSLPQK